MRSKKNLVGVVCFLLLTSGCTWSKWDLNDPQQLATLDATIRITASNATTIFLQAKKVSADTTLKLIAGCDVIGDVVKGNDVIVPEELAGLVPQAVQYVILDAIQLARMYASAGDGDVLSPAQKQLIMAGVGGVKSGAQRHLALVTEPKDMAKALKKAF